jgi:hypothetical protein
MGQVNSRDQGERRPEVVVLGFQAVEPHDLVSALHAGECLLRQPEVVLGMRPARRFLLSRLD